MKRSGSILRFAGVAERRKATLVWPFRAAATERHHKMPQNTKWGGTPLYFTTTHLSEK